MKKFIVATGNAGKLSEIQQSFAAEHWQIQSQGELGIASVAETGLTFVENALIKARHVCQQTQLPAMADDSGLVVPVLNGAPGLYSARYAGESATDADNIRRLLTELHTFPNPEQREACFVSVMVYLRHAFDPNPIISYGQWAGRILSEPKGEAGFGYDPVFYVPETNCTAAELSVEVKNQLSHRGQALRHLKKRLLATKMID